MILSNLDTKMVLRLGAYGSQMLQEHPRMGSEGLKGVQNGSWKLEDASRRDQRGSKWCKDGQQVALGGAKVAPGCLK